MGIHYLILALKYVCVGVLFNVSFPQTPKQNSITMNLEFILFIYIENIDLGFFFLVHLGIISNVL